MARRGRGGILTVASTVSFQPVVRQATYSASKAMVRTFTEALTPSCRLRGGGDVPVPAMRTEFIDVAGGRRRRRRTGLRL